MVRQHTNDKKSVYYRQFQGGYAKVKAIELRALMEGYKQRLFRRNEVRVFAARLEASALHKESRVSLYRIVNCDSKKKGNRRLTQSQIDAALANLDEWLPLVAVRLAEETTERTKPVARRIIRHIARGGSTTVEGLFLLAYLMRRIPQRKPMQRLKEHEHYARFRYAEFEEWTGVPRATQSRLLPRLMHRGFLNTVEVHQQNQNAYGQLFIDGPALSLIRARQYPRRQLRHGAKVQAYEKRSTPIKRNVNTRWYETSTLRKKNPRKEMQNEKDLFQGIKCGALASHHNPEMRRIALKAMQILQDEQRQVA